MFSNTDFSTAGAEAVIPGVTFPSMRDGHREIFPHAQGRPITSRHFNSLSIDPQQQFITKTSRATQKIAQEFYWYRTLPRALQAFVPGYLEFWRGAERCSLTMRYYKCGTLTDTFIYRDPGEGFWEPTLTRLFELVERFKRHTGLVEEEEVCPRRVYRDKTGTRLMQLRSQNSLWIHLLERETIRVNDRVYLGLPRLTTFINETVESLVQSVETSIIHGDFCFNNILYDVVSGTTKLIDPRAEFGGKCMTIHGDPRYDIAKLRHSFCGNYDSIVAGEYELTRDSKENFVFSVRKKNQLDRESLFDRLSLNFGYRPDEVRFIEALLFLSMIPLHAESLRNQLAFFVTAIIKLNGCLNIEKTPDLTLKGARLSGKVVLNHAHLS